MGAAEVHGRLLLAVVVVLVAARLVGRLAERTGQPRVIGEIAAGILLGPSALGALAPDLSGYVFPAPVVAAMQSPAQLGLVLFLFLAGTHLDLSAIADGRRTVAAVAPVSVAVPFGLALALGLVVHPAFGGATDPMVFALFLGSAVAVTALPVLARILSEVGLDRHRLGGIALACAAVNDVVAWCLLALVTALAAAAGPAGALTTLALAVTFLAVMFGVVRPALTRLPELHVRTALVVALGAAWTAEVIGIHAIIGAFVAGVVMPRRPGWARRTGERLDTAVRALLLPVFFAVAGLATRIDRLTGAALLLAAAVVLVATLGKLGAGTLAARAAGESWRDATTLGVLLNTRGVTELVIASLGLQLGVIGPVVYTVLVVTALVTTVATAPLLGLVRRAPTTPRHRSSPHGCASTDPLCIITTRDAGHAVTHTGPSVAGEATP